MAKQTNGILERKEVRQYDLLLLYLATASHVRVARLRLPMTLFNADTEYFSFERDFSEAFSPPIDSEVLFDDLECYLSSVEGMVGALEHIFGDN
jgi:hypothetical protein